MVHWVQLGGGGRGGGEGGEVEGGATSSSAASYGRRYIRTRGFQQEEAAGRALYSGLMDIKIMRDVFIPRLAKKISEWRTPDSPFWVRPGTLATLPVHLVLGDSVPMMPDTGPSFG